MKSSSSEYERSVFINCPFDADYEPLLAAILFAVEACGYRVRCSLETDDGGRVRIEKILAVVGGCRFGVHDISRTEPNERGLPRFNMPFELGVFLGAARLGTAKQKRKVALILDREPYRYREFLSDIAGQDVRTHGGEPEEAVRAVRDWLNANAPDVLIPGGGDLIDWFRRFTADLPRMCAEHPVEPDRLTYTDRLHLIGLWLTVNNA